MLNLPECNLGLLFLEQNLFASFKQISFGSKLCKTSTFKIRLPPGHFNVLQSHIERDEVLDNALECQVDISFFDDAGHYSKLHVSLLKNLVALSENIAQLTFFKKRKLIYTQKKSGIQNAGTKPYYFRPFWGWVFPYISRIHTDYITVRVSTSTFQVPIPSSPTWIFGSPKSKQQIFAR